MLNEVLWAVWLGAMIGVLIKLGSPHRRYGSWLFAAFVGGFGGVLGLFVARSLGVNRNARLITLEVACGIAAIAVVLYAAISRAAFRRLARQGMRFSRRPPLVF